MSPTFKRPPVERQKSESPERLFDDLPRTRDGVPSLWAHQADMLRQYHADHTETADVALELPTGAGKTLPSLLIAEWRRTSLGERVAYACPTVQLAHQVSEQAAREGIEVVVLVGSHRDWATADVARYDGARTVAVTTYSSIFNSNPAITHPGAILFDDAHAAEQYVAGAWSVAVSRHKDPDLYQRLLGAIGGELSGIHLQRLQSTEPDTATRNDVRLLAPGALRRRAERVDLVLGAEQGRVKYRYSMIRSNLERCLLYFGWEGILVRPYTPPTSMHAHFADAAQRIYISATLGDGGELERAFGRASIERLPVPAGWDSRGSGRRFFVFPELLRDVSSASVASSIVESAGKALVIAPSDRQLTISKAAVIPPGMDEFGKGGIEATLDEFRRAHRGVLALANRYDGIDLADESCRVTVLCGLPNGEHLQERFLIRSLRAGRVLEERLRTRVVQGAGRCTRGLKDHSVVVVLGDDLTRFLQRPEVRSALRAETQAEISFGMMNSEVVEAEFLEAVRSCLEQDDDWQSQAEPIISDLRREAARSVPEGTDSLAASASEEVKAWDQIWRGDLAGASETAVGVARLLTEEVLRPYRALWMYFAAEWQAMAAAETGDDALAASAAELLRKAHAAAQGTSWLREIAPLPPGEKKLDPLDDAALASIEMHPSRGKSAAKWARQTTEMIEGLSGTEAGAFERGLSVLGSLLGAEAFKPAGKGRADSVWLFADQWWLTLEAKSESSHDGLLSMDDVRQANTQLASLSEDRQTAPPEGSTSVIITPRRLADPDAVAIAGDHLCYCSPDEVLAVAHDAVEAWRGIRASAMNLEGAGARAVIQQKLADHRVLPTLVRERIASDRLVG